MKIKSIFNIEWDIKNGSGLSKEDVSFIKNYNAGIFHNDLTGKLWSFDTKLPSGKWMENISFNNSLTKAKALVL